MIQDKGAIKLGPSFAGSSCALQSIGSRTAEVWLADGFDQHGTCGLVAMTSASHAEGRQFDPGQVYCFHCALDQFVCENYISMIHACIINIMVQSGDSSQHEQAFTNSIQYHISWAETVLTFAWSTSRTLWSVATIINSGFINWAHGVVVSHPLSMREALGSIPSVSTFE